MNLGRLLILAGIALMALGIIVIAISKLNLPVGRLPGDVIYRGKNTTVYFPWVTCLLISLLGTLLLWLINRRM
jgi:hypothetical protein